jgi:NADPH:quinone reductase-like Zn-dependent oxidoreductase
LLQFISLFIFIHKIFGFTLKVSRYVKTSRELVVKVPEHISFEVAASIPMNFCTAYHALHNKAQIEKGEKVLIHAAAGGTGLIPSTNTPDHFSHLHSTGQAAIQFCQLVGTEIFVTVGSDEKRKFIEREYGIPLDHIFNSRTLEFAEQIMKVTNGKGQFSHIHVTKANCF